jgi:hypothetical protein
MFANGRMDVMAKPRRKLPRTGKNLENFPFVKSINFLKSRLESQIRAVFDIETHPQRCRMPLAQKAKLADIPQSAYQTADDYLKSHDLLKRCVYYYRAHNFIYDDTWEDFMKARDWAIAVKDGRLLKDINKEIQYTIIRMEAISKLDLSPMGQRPKSVLESAGKKTISIKALKPKVVKEIKDDKTGND